MMDSLQMQKAERAVSVLREFFPDFLVMLRPGSSGLWWRSSDSVWAKGAAERYVERCRMGEFLDNQTFFMTQSREGDHGQER